MALLEDLVHYFELHFVIVGDQDPVREVLELWLEISVGVATQNHVRDHYNRIVL